jgi:hypothetical protein
MSLGPAFHTTDDKQYYTLGLTCFRDNTCSGFIAIIRPAEKIKPPSVLGKVNTWGQKRKKQARCCTCVDLKRGQSPNRTTAISTVLCSSRWATSRVKRLDLYQPHSGRKSKQTGRIGIEYPPREEWMIWACLVSVSNTKTEQQCVRRGQLGLTHRQTNEGSTRKSGRICTSSTSAQEEAAGGAENLGWGRARSWWGREDLVKQWGWDKKRNGAVGVIATVEAASNGQWSGSWPVPAQGLPKLSSPSVPCHGHAEMQLTFLGNQFSQSLLFCRGKHRNNFVSTRQ